jgi:hypothetical protein
MRRANVRLARHGSRHFHHLSQNPHEDYPLSQRYDPCDGSQDALAMAIEDFVLMPLWAELTDLLDTWVECREYHQYVQIFHEALSSLQASLAHLFEPRYWRDLLSPAWKFDEASRAAARTPVPDDGDP